LRLEFMIWVRMNPDKTIMRRFLERGAR
jgi:hypothetical protein